MTMDTTIKQSMTASIEITTTIDFFDVWLVVVGE